MKGKIQFREQQSFRNTWMFYLVMGICVLSIVGVVVPMWIQSGDSEALIGLIIAAIVTVGVGALLSLAKLETTIDDKAIYYRFPPFVNSEKVLTKGDIKEVYVRKYRPIAEYGGWGYRVRPGKGRALNVGGKMGLQIVQSNGKALLIGTQKASDMERAIRKLKENWEMNG